MTDPKLAPFFNPKGIAVVGASKDTGKLGFFLARNLVFSGYPGAVHLVNPKGGEMLGIKMYPTIAEIPDPVDLAVILVPPPAVPASMEECARRGISSVIVAAGGFREAGPEGAALEAECLRIAREHGMRMVGPNCVGFVDTHLPFDTTFLQPPGPPAGDIAMLSQSGAMCAAVIDWVRGQGFGLSHLYSMGNQADVNETDMLEPFAQNPHTRAITLYIEMVSNGRRFVETAARVSRQKPVVALKVGRFEGGRRAAASHTGALAGAETAYDAAFARAGVLRANTTEELFNWAKALAYCPLPKGRSVAILTNSGGPGVAGSDAVEGLGLNMAALDPVTKAKLKEILPSAASANNPVDMLASANERDYAACLRLVLEDPNVDMVLAISPPPPPTTTGAIAKALIPIIQNSDKPVVVALMGDRLIAEGVELLRAANIPEYRFPEQAASALAALWRRAELLQRLDESPIEVQGVRAQAEILLQGLPAGQFMPPETANAILEAYGIRTAAPILAGDCEAAMQAAEEMGYPVVVKVASPDISHKSDVGGVVLNLRDEAEVSIAYDHVIKNAQAARPDARILGVHVQKMLPTGQEVIVGMVRDPQFGPLVMFGSGGVEVEGLKDVAFALAPLSREEAGRLLDSTWAGRKLKGFRSLAPADRDAVIDALAKLAQLALDLPQIQEIEINPLRVLEKGAWVVDARAKI